MGLCIKYIITIYWHVISFYQWIFIDQEIGIYGHIVTLNYLRQSYTKCDYIVFTFSYYVETLKYTCNILSVLSIIKALIGVVFKHGTIITNVVYEIILKIIKRYLNVIFFDCVINTISVMFTGLFCSILFV